MTNGLEEDNYYPDLYDRFIGNRYSIENLVLMLSNQCNLECNHCVVESWHKKSPLIKKETINSAIRHATEFNISNVLIYGWEPFLQYKELLPYTINESFRRWMKTVQIWTNGFRWHSKEFTKNILDAHQEVSSKYGWIICYCISVDEYHQKKIPQTSIANIIKTFKEWDFPNIRIAMTTFSSDESYNDAYWPIFEILQKNWIHLLENNNQSSIYPAYLDEIIELKEENLQLIHDKSWVEDNLDSTDDVENLIRTNFQYWLFDNVIARRMDLWEWLKNYLIFPKNKKIIEQGVSTKPILAWRLKPENRQYPEFYPEWWLNKSDCIIFAPDNNVYMFPAQISKQIAPVAYKGQDFIDLKYEILDAVKWIIE